MRLYNNPSNTKICWFPFTHPALKCVRCACNELPVLTRSFVHYKVWRHLLDNRVVGEVPHPVSCHATTIHLPTGFSRPGIGKVFQEVWLLENGHCQEIIDSPPNAHNIQTGAIAVLIVNNIHCYCMVLQMHVGSVRFHRFGVNCRNSQVVFKTTSGLLIFWNSRYARWKCCRNQHTDQAQLNCE